MIDTTALFSDITTHRLGVRTLEQQNRDRIDFHDVDAGAVHQALADAYQAGLTAGIAAELGITHAVHSTKCSRFPWQVFMHGGLCVLVNRQADDHVVIRSRFCEPNDGPLRQPVHAIPLDVLAQVRQARLVRI